MKKAWKHFITITEHKWLVLKYCIRVGLYWQGLLHDISKYSWTEFQVGCKYFQGNRSPNNVEREVEGYSKAWLHHKGRNKHHYEYWMDYSNNSEEGLVGVPMPKRYVVEMFLDRIAASKIYLRTEYTDDAPLKYFQKARKIEKKESGRGSMLHPKTESLLKKLLVFLAKEGEEKTLFYIRNHVLRTRK